MKKKAKEALPEKEELLRNEAEPGEAEAEEKEDGAAMQPAEKNAEKEVCEKAAEKTKEGMEEDIALFHELFPEIGAKDIPEIVWQSVEKGESLSASYALYFIRSLKEQERIRSVNEKNEKAAPPKISNDGKECDYFSPEAVKGMSREEIKKNYHAILNSMDKWN